MTTPPIKLLLLEDDPRDAELIQRALQRDGIACETTIARSQADLHRHIDQPFDAVVADYRLPDLNAMHAIEALRQHHPDAPLVVVSGSTTEDQLLSMLRLGADDYLLKDRLARLGAAVRGAQERHRLRRERAMAEAAARQRETELRHLQRVESIGLLTGGIAHDFNNLLTVVLGNADLALTLLDPSKPAYALVREVTSAARRAAALTQQLLSFARRQSIGPQALDLGEVVRTFLAMAKPVLGRAITIEFVAKPGLSRVHADRLQLEQVVMNLLLNARDAMPSGGRIDVEVGPDGPDTATIRVRDHGVGITREVQNRLFEPFFTTKPAGIGTGLGLSTSLAIVRQFGGDILVHSEPGQGAEFCVRLPRLPQRHGTQPEVLSVAPPIGRTVLVVEAEPMLRSTVANMLSQAGYDVLTAVSTDDEATLDQATQRPIDLVLAETQDAAALNQWLDAAFRDKPRPPLMRLQADGHHRPGEAPPDLLMKPFTAQQLLTKVRELCKPAP